MFNFSYCLTLVQPVQSGDVIVAHLGGCAKRNIWIGDRLHGGFIVTRESIPGIIQKTEMEFVLFMS